MARLRATRFGLALPPGLGGGRGRLQLLEERRHVPLGRLHLAAKPPGGAQEAVGDRAEDDQCEDDGDDPHDQEEHGPTLTGAPR
jgi:hypothetical protein